MSLRDTHKWQSESEAVTRFDLIQLANAALRNEFRTIHEQAALLRVCDLLDDPEIRQLRVMAEESFKRLYVCKCGEYSHSFHCSISCENDFARDILDDVA